MEYIDGEDLGSLLRRIGRLPSDKAIEIARELCAGLAAAHEKGVLHRDLKPSNVMIDGRGKVRLTDFGIASMTGHLDPVDARHGTPAFMAPEQWTAKEVSIKSDIYSLGLVLYELFTGKRAFTADTAKEMIRLQRDTTPRNPSSLVEDLDPAVERVILRCLEKDPAKRPPSALAVAAAGETPSPELVAEAGDVGALPPAVAWAYLASVVISLGLVVWMTPSTQISGIASLPKSPELLRERARDVIGNLGFSGTARDSSYGFTLRRDLIEYVAEHDESPDRWQRLSAVDASLVRFWYRQSPRDLVPQRLTSFLASAHDPPPLISGMVNLELDPRGRLRAFSTVPPELDDAKRSGSQTDWGALFGEAGFDLAEFEPVEPEWNPASYAEELAAWRGVYPSSPSTPIRVEAAAYRGKPIAFRIIEPWTTPDRMDLAATSSPGRPIGRVLFTSGGRGAYRRQRARHPGRSPARSPELAFRTR